MNDSYLFLWLDIDPSASSRESSSASHCPLEEIFQVTKPRWKTKQCTWVLALNEGNTHTHSHTHTQTHTHTHTHTDTRSCRQTVLHTHLSLLSTGHMEMSVPPKRCSLMSGHVAARGPGPHVRSSCPAVLGAASQPWTPPCPPPPSCTSLCLHPQEGN